MAAAIAVAVAVAAIVLSARGMWRGSMDPVLASLVNHDVRSLEPRLSGGFPWAPFRRDMRVAAPEEGVFASAIESGGEPVLRGEPTTVERHRNGLVLLLNGQLRQALAVLTETAESAGDASAWNDLCAAYHEAAVRFDAPELLTDAVTAADRALALDPTLAEALFNRALMIERLGLRTDARKAWIRFLEVDPDSGWADEARTHLQALPVEPPFMALVDAQYDRIATDTTAAMALYQRDPFNARGQGMVQVLGRWGDAIRAGDSAAAARHLGVARNLGAAVTTRGDLTLKEAVAVIEASDAAATASLAAAHSAYRDGIKAFGAGLPVKAEPLMRGAADAFRRANSPVALPASIFAANALYEQGRHDEAERLHEQLLATDPKSPAYRAFIHWQLGICNRSRANWGAAIAHFEQSAALFERLSETQNVAIVRRLLAFVYDRIGDHERGWRNRIAALRHGLGSSSPLVHEKTASSIAETALLRKQWYTAESFLTLHAEISRRTKDDTLLVDALLLRAVVRDRLAKTADAKADLAEAKEIAARIEDPAYRASAHVAELRAMAMLRTTAPDAAEALLTEAIALRGTQSDPARLPVLLLQRARARRATGNAAGALADVERGIASLEQHRETIPEGEARWGAFNGAEELFEDGVELALESGDAARALRFAERARVRALLDTYGRSPELDHHALPARIVAVEYVSLPTRLVIFTVDAGGVHAQSVEYPRETLEKDVAELTRSMSTSATVGGNAGIATMYRRLIAPVESRLANAASVVFVPDGVTATVPFGALTDAAGMPLLQRHPVVIGGSVAAFVAASERRPDRRAPRSALVVAADEATADLSRLDRVLVEAREIAGAYANATHVHVGGDWGEVVDRAPEAEIIHFGGHAVGDDRGLEPASIVVRQNGRARRVGVSEIAKLTLRRAPTVVLAGCGTARGQRRAAEGVISVAHGFLSAGAPSVIATLWPINDDAAARFFPRLHRRLAKGMAPAEALRGAQLESIQRGDVPASLWAAIENFGS